jgi:hypothetical protein
MEPPPDDPEPPTGAAATCGCQYTMPTELGRGAASVIVALRVARIAAERILVMRLDAKFEIECRLGAVISMMERLCFVGRKLYQELKATRVKREDDICEVLGVLVLESPLGLS